MRILTVNAGSSSVRLGLFAAERGLVRLLRSHRHAGHPDDAAPALTAFVDDEAPAAVVHRVVHGGITLIRPTMIDDAVVATIAGAVPLAPLHNPVTLTWIAAARSQFVAASQVAVFDTGLFADLPAVASTYALPPELREGVRRLGFHGLAHRSMHSALGRSGAPTGRVITVQLGAGCSAAALRDGVAIDTSMGFTPTEGLVMATRSGDVDPGLLLHVMARQRLSPAAMDQLLTEKAGLQGLAGASSVGDLLARADEDARMAVDLFCYRIRKYVGAYLAVLGGCDAIAFGGGIGEHVPAVRARALGGLDDLGILLDPAANDIARAPARISAAGSRTEVWVVPTDEETVLAESAVPFLGEPARTHDRRPLP